MKSFSQHQELRKWVVVARPKYRVSRDSEKGGNETKKEENQVTVTTPEKITPTLRERWLIFRNRKKIFDLYKPIEQNQYITDSQNMDIYNVHETEVQFPYNNLRQYLESRGWEELAEKVAWTVPDNGKEENSTEFGKVHPRSKTFINSLKIRLQFYHAEKCSTIIKNEAHVRLSSSMWYVSKTLLLYGTIGFIFLAISGFLLYKNSDLQSVFFLSFGTQVMISLAILFVSFRIRVGIERFLHYQRVREIFYVLETAITAAKSMKENGFEKIFGGLVESISKNKPHIVNTDQ